MSLTNLINSRYFNGKLLFLLLAGFSLMIALPALAAGAEGASEMAWGLMGMKLYGGLALFLFGMASCSCFESILESTRPDSI